MATYLYQAFEETPEYYKERKESVDLNKLKSSTTLYVGNLSFYTTEPQLFEYFSRCGDLNKIIMGLNKHTKTPCGFCFIEYHLREDAERAMNLLNNTNLDNRIIRIDMDTGFVEGRQFGRGWSGAQKRDELSNKYDPDRPRDTSSSKIINIMDIRRDTEKIKTTKANKIK